MTAAALVLSFRAAGRVLHTDRGTLAGLERAGILRSVPWGRTRRIPLAELERLAREGWRLTDTGRPRRAPKAKPGTGDAAAAIRSIDLEAL